METITISRKEYEDLQRKSKLVERLKDLDIDFVRQVVKSKEDLKHGRFKRLA